MVLILFPNGFPTECKFYKWWPIQGEKRKEEEEKNLSKSVFLLNNKYKIIKYNSTEKCKEKSKIATIKYKYY